MVPMGPAICVRLARTRNVMISSPRLLQERDSLTKNETAKNETANHKTRYNKNGKSKHHKQETEANNPVGLKLNHHTCPSNKNLGPEELFRQPPALPRRLEPQAPRVASRARRRRGISDVCQPMLFTLAFKSVAILAQAIYRSEASFPCPRLHADCKTFA